MMLSQLPVKLCRTPLHHDTIAFLSGLDSEKQEEFINSARKQGLLPFLHTRLKNEEIPGEIQKALTDAYYGNISVTLQLVRQLHEVTALFEEAGIPCCLIKGVPVTEELFGNIAAYPSHDIDLLIHRKDMQKSVVALQKRGYTPLSPTDRQSLSEGYSVGFSAGGNSRPLDLHYHLGEKQFFDIPETFWWEGIRNIPLQGKNIPVLSKEKMLLFASLHLFGHGFVPFKFLLAFERMIHLYAGEINMERLLQSAKQQQILIPFLLCSHLIKDRLNTPLPAAIEEELQALSRYRKYHFRQISDRLFDEETSFPLLYLRLASLIYSPWQFCLHLLRWIFPSPALIAKRHRLKKNSPLLWLYYPLSPLIRLFKKRPL